MHEDKGLGVPLQFAQSILLNGWIVKIVKVVQCANCVTGREQAFTNMRTNKSHASSDQDIHSASLTRSDGGVDTVGGFVTRASLGLEYRLSPHLSLIMDGGYLTASDGNFATPYVGFNLSYVMETIAQDQKATPVTEMDLIQTINGAFARPTNGILMRNVREVKLTG